MSPGILEGVTVTVTLSELLPPEPVHDSVYVAFVIGLTVVLPVVVFAPDHAPLAVQVVALVVVQFNVEAAPAAIEAGLLVRLTVGGLAELTVTVTLSEV